MATKTTKAMSAGDPVAETARRREAAHAVVVERGRLVSRGRALTDPNFSSVELDPPASDLERLEAIARLPMWEREWAEARLLAAQADEEYHQEQASQKQEKLAGLQPEKRQAVAALASALLDARRAADHLRVIEEQEEIIAGPQAERLGAAWSATIGTGDALHQPHLSYWLQYVREHGYDVVNE